MNRKMLHPLPPSQQGLALVMALVFLLVLTIMGVNATSKTILEEKMSRNMKDSITAFQAAETALGEGESVVKNFTSLPTPVTTCAASPCNVVWQLDTLTNLKDQSNSWWQTKARTYSGSLPTVAMQPMYIIEYFGTNYTGSGSMGSGSGGSGSTLYYYRITARGVGGSDSAIATVQSIYAIAL